MKIAPVTLKISYRQGGAGAGTDQCQDQTLLSVKFNSSGGSRCALGQGGRGVEATPQLCFAGCDTRSVRALTTQMGLKDPDQPHLAPHP